MRISQTELNHIISGKISPTVVSFGAEWSGNSEMLFNIMDDMDKEFGENVYFCQIDIDKDPNFANDWGIREVPTTLIISNNEVVDHFNGIMSRGRIRQKIKAYL